MECHEPRGRAVGTGGKPAERELDRAHARYAVHVRSANGGRRALKRGRMAGMTLPALPEESFQRVLCVVAHPDDMEYGTSAAVARWTARGIEVGYLLLTRGEAGMPNPPEETARLRAAEQQAACAVVGVRHLTVLEHPDGVLVYGLDLRRDICREIRRFKPDVVLGAS